MSGSCLQGFSILGEIGKLLESLPVGKNNTSLLIVGDVSRTSLSGMQILNSDKTSKETLRTFHTQGRKRKYTAEKH